MLAEKKKIILERIHNPQYVEKTNSKTSGWWLWKKTETEKVQVLEDKACFDKQLVELNAYEKQVAVNV